MLNGNVAIEIWTFETGTLGLKLKEKLIRLVSTYIHLMNKCLQCVLITIDFQGFGDLNVAYKTGS